MKRLAILPIGPLHGELALLASFLEAPTPAVTRTPPLMDLRPSGTKGRLGKMQGHGLPKTATTQAEQSPWGADNTTMATRHVAEMSGPRRQSRFTFAVVAVAPWATGQLASALVVAVEYFADRGVFKDSVNRVSDDSGDREDFDLVGLLFRRKWQRVGHHDL